MIRAALRYAALGLPVLPLTGKIPFPGTNGVNESTLDPNTIRQLWTEHPNANIGIALHNHLVVDVDQKHDGPPWLRDHARLLRGLTLTSKTGGGGWHFWFLRPQNVDLRGLITKGVDLRRGSGQYVVAPPSVHPETGAYYQWVRAWPSKPVVVPPWLLSLCRRPETPRHVIAKYHPGMRAKPFQRAAHYLDHCPVAVSGSGGHNATFRTCLKVVSQFPELTDEELWILISDWNLRCVPPWSERELRHKLDDALRVGGRKAA